MANLVIQTLLTPTHTVNGKIWIYPPTGQAYIYIDSVWVPFAGGDIYDPYRIPITVFIGGVDVTEMVDQSSLKIQNILTVQVDSCSFVVNDVNNILDISPGDELLIYYKETELSVPQIVFGGEVSSAPQDNVYPGSSAYIYKVSGVDFSRRLKRKVVVEVYENKTSGYIIKDMISIYCPEFTTADVADGETVASISFSYKSVFDCISEIAKLTGYEWYVDYERGIHFIAKDTTAAPYQLTDNISTTGNYKNLSINTDKSQLRNRVYVRGGFYLSDLYPHEVVADGVQTAFILPYPPRAPISVYVDSGSGYVAHTLGVDFIDTSGYDFLVNYTDKVIVNLDHATLSSGHKLKVTFKYEIQVLTVDTNEISVEDIKMSEGGDGYYDYPINDSSILTIAEAHARAQAELELYSFPTIDGSFVTDQIGYEAGQLLTVNMPSRGLTSREFTIQSVTKHFLSSGKFEYTVKFATTSKSFVQLMTSIIDQTKEIIVRQNETLHELSSIEETEIEATDVAASTAEHEGDFVYDDADSKYNQAQYS